MAQFKVFDHIKNEDGTYTIKKVPIFRLGKHRGFNYDAKWFEKAAENHRKNAEGGYFPSVILGHNAKDGEEKPSRGHFDNLTLDGDVINADLIKIPETVFELIKDREYPHRSIEVYPKKAEISALALLGGSAPYHKLPLLEVSNFWHEGDDNVVLNFGEVDGKLIPLSDAWGKRKAGEKLRDFIDMLTQRLWKRTSDVTSGDENLEIVKQGLIDDLVDGQTLLENEQFDNEQEDNVVKFTEEQLKQAKIDAAAEATKAAREQFKADFGMYPEELKAKQKADAEKARKDEISHFCEGLKTTDHGDGRVLAPKIVDDYIEPFLEAEDSVKFADSDEEQDITTAKRTIIKKIIEFAADDTLFADMGEHGRVNHKTITFGEHGDPVNEEAAKFDTKAKALMGKNPELTYMEALDQVMGE